MRFFKNASFNLVLFYKALRWMPQDFINNQLFSRLWLGSVWRQALTQTKVGQVLWPGVPGPWWVNVGCVYKRGGRYDISVLQQVDMFFDWDRLLDEGLAFVQAGVPSCRDDVTIRSCANFKCDVADVNKEIRTDFKGIKWVSGECYQPYREYIVHNI